MKSIYDQFDAAFANVSAFSITKGDERVGRVVIKFPKDGAGRLYAYVHVYGSSMVRGSASGYGYDKRSAAVIDAAKKLDHDDRDSKNAYHVSQTRIALQYDNGHDWTRHLENAGYRVDQVI